MTKQLLLEKISKEEMIQHIKDYYNYAKTRLDINKKPKVIFNDDPTNADDFLGKTGYYDPKSKTIHLFITDRHPKDIVRSFAHELIHHYQNLHERLPDEILSQTKDVDYASKNKDLRDIEREAFEKGNMMFRDWTDSLKAKNIKESKMGKKLLKEYTDYIKNDYDGVVGLDDDVYAFIKKQEEGIAKLYAYKGATFGARQFIKDVPLEELENNTFIMENPPKSHEETPEEPKVDGKEMDMKEEKVKKSSKGMSYDAAKKAGVKNPKAADRRPPDGKISSYEAAVSKAINKTKQRKMEESTELQEADPRLKKVLTQQERTLSDYKTKREQNIYNELMARILKQGK
jgi:hypothetical protein